MTADLVIEPATTTTAAFIGPTHRGPLAKPVLVGSLAELERVFGGRRALRLSQVTMPNYIWHSARAFFDEGGAELYVQRVAREDGRRPVASDYRGDRPAGSRRRPRGLRALARQHGVALVAAPGSTHGIASGYRPEALAIARGLIDHARRRGDRFALLDAGQGSTPEVLAFRTDLGDAVAALHHPWIRPVATSPRGRVTPVPPSGFVAGAIAAAELAGGVMSELGPLAGVAQLDADLDAGDLSALAEEGVDVIRAFEDGSHRIWGDRTLSSGPEWKYVSISRYLIYLEHSIDDGLRRAVFETNDEAALAGVRGSIEGFLMAEWRSGRLLGSRADQAFFVRCDRTTMTQADIDAGRLVCLVGVAPIRPAEFITLRIKQRIAAAA